jgi:DNA polymerase-3 subunit gamma/tau
MSTLYRKYRPQTFAEVFGQDHIKTALQNELIAEQLASAYLFCGPRAVGKTTMARLLGKAANCLKRKKNSAEPCNICPACVSITAGNNLEFIEIDAASQTGVDNVRDNVIAAARISPSLNKFKVFIIDEVHMLSISAFNALLKLLEEPPARVIFILCTTEVHKVPETIVSRCQRFEFQRIKLTDLVKKLEYILACEKISPETGVLEAIARRADGYLRDAESLLGQIIALGEGQVTKDAAELVIPRGNLAEVIELYGYLSGKDGASAIRLINNLADSGVNLKNFLADMALVGRKLLLAKISPDLPASLGLDFGEILEPKLAEVASGLSLPRILLTIEKMTAAGHELKTSFIASLPLEVAIAELCSTETVSQPLTAPIKTPERPVHPEAPAPGNKLEKKIEPEKIVSAPLPDLDPTLEMSVIQIEERWPEVMIRIKNYNHSLAFVLQTGVISGVRAGKLFLIFKYKFHRDRLLDARIKSDFERIISEVYQKRLGLEVEVNEDLVFKAAAAPEIQTPVNAPAPVSEGKNNDILSNLLNTFGGEVVG